MRQDERVTRGMPSAVPDDGLSTQQRRLRPALIVNTGDGKGKSTAAFGMAVRVLGHGMRLGVVQFIKGAMETGEERFLRRFPEQVQFHAMGGFNQAFHRKFIV